MNGRHTGIVEPHRSRLAVIIVTMTVVGATVTLFGLGYQQLRLPNEATRSEPSANVSTSAARSTPSPCIKVDAARRDALAEAEQAIVQWHKHIEAMNALFGMRTEFKEAMRDWDRSRPAADRSVLAFQGADTKYRRLMGEYGPCADENNAGEALLLEARQSVTRWAGDIKDAKDLRAERMSCPAAAARWKRTDVRRMSDLSRYEGARAVYNAVWPRGEPS
ncbi:hypothetical protein [Flindersiella endophytica]